MSNLFTAERWRRIARRPHGLLAAIIAAFVLAVLSGCSDPCTDCTQPSGAATAVVTAARANTAQPVYLPALQQYVDRAVTDQQYVLTVTSDGVPAQVQAFQLANPYTDNDHDHDQQQDRNRATVLGMLTAPAKTAQANPLGAITLAAQSLHDYPGAKTLLVLDSGVQTVPPLAMQNNLLYPTLPVNTIVDGLRRQGALPNLTGVDVVWIGLGQVQGQSVQPDLGTAARDRLRKLWDTTLKTAGAKSVTFLGAVLPAAPPPAGAPRVAVVPVPPVDSPTAAVPPSTVTRTTEATVTRTEQATVTHTAQATVTTTTAGPAPVSQSFPDTVVHFAPDSADLTDPVAAATQLEPIAQQLIDGGYTRIVVTGTTSSAPTRWASHEKLADARATVVADVLAAAGVDRSRITINGLGSNFDGFVDDINPDGSVNDKAAAINRQVLITADH